MSTFRLTTTALVVAAATVAGIGSAGAVTFDFTVGADGGATTGLQPTADPETWTVGTQTITAQAFSINSTPINSSTSTVDAQLGIYTGGGFGIGVTSLTEPAGSSPQHTVSNETNHDFVVFQLPASFNTLSMTLNQFCSAGGDPTNPGTCASISQIGNDNADFYFGNGSLSAIAAATAAHTETLGALTAGLTHIDSKTLTGGVSHSGDETLNLTGLPQGNLLVVIASLSDGVGSSNAPDYFKIGNLTATQTTHNVPEPGTIAVFGVGLAGLAYLRRRQRASA
jgi:hypothetical protein